MRKSHVPLLVTGTVAVALVVWLYHQETQKAKEGSVQDSTTVSPTDDGQKSLPTTDEAPVEAVTSSFRSSDASGSTSSVAPRKEETPSPVVAAQELAMDALPDDVSPVTDDQKQDTASQDSDGPVTEQPPQDTDPDAPEEGEDENDGSEVPEDSEVQDDPDDLQEEHDTVTELPPTSPVASPKAYDPSTSVKGSLYVPDFEPIMRLSDAAKELENDL